MRAFGWCFDGLFAGILVDCLVLTLWVWYNILSAGFVVRLRGWVFVFVFRGCGSPGLGGYSEVWFGLRLWFLIWFWSGVVWGGCLMFWFVGLEFGLLVPVGLSVCCDLLVLV